MSILVEFSITPIGHGESVSRYVARALKVVSTSGLPYKLGPMGTTIEAPTWDQAFSVVRKCVDRVTKDCRRVSVSIKVDCRKGSSGRLSSKVLSVQKHLSRKLSAL